MQFTRFSNAVIIILTKLSFIIILNSFSPLNAQPADVESRRYTLRLKLDNFSNYSTLMQDAEAFSRRVEAFISANFDTSELKIKFDLDDREIQHIRYLDTGDHQLNANGFTFLEEIEIEETDSGGIEVDDKAQYYLMYHTAEAQFAQMMDMSVKRFKSPKIRPDDERFIENIHGGSSRFTRIASARFKPAEYILDTSWKAANIFPVLASFLDLRAELKNVTPFKSRETRFSGEIEFDLDNYIEYTLRCLTDEPENGTASVHYIEFSFAYETDNLLTKKMPQYAETFYNAMQNQKDVDANGGIIAEDIYQKLNIEN